MNKVELRLQDMALTKKGDLWLINGELYILACVGRDKYIFISVSDGVRWDEIFECKDENLTVDNITTIIKRDNYDYNATEVQYIGNKTILIKEN